MKVHGIMGVRNEDNADNDSSYLVNKRRQYMLDELCDTIRDSVRLLRADGDRHHG